MRGPIPEDVWRAILAYRDAVRRHDIASEAQPSTGVESAALDLADACLEWAARVDRLPLQRPRPLATIARTGGRS